MAESSKVILLAEDEESIRKLITPALQSMGYVVHACKDGAEALAVGRDFPGPIDLLITDIRMPGMDGKQLAGNLCQARPDLKVLYISGFSELDAADLTPCNNRDGAFLPKPFTLSQLRRKVQEIFLAG